MENSRKSKSFEARLKSFQPNVLFDPWPSTKPTPESLARAGFYRKFSFTYKDVVRCDDCGLELDDWNAEDDPIAEHIQRSKDCPHIKLDVQRQMRLLAMEEADRQQQLAMQKAKDEAFSCRRCTAKFPSNSKLHKHVAERHTKKPSVPQASLSTVELATSNLPAAPLPTPPASTPSTTPKLSYAAVAKSAKSTKASLPTPPASPHPKISYATLAESTSKSTSPPVPSHIKPKASTTPRNYMTMEDLFRRFSPTNHQQPTKAAKPKAAKPKKSGCKSKTPVLIKSATPTKVAPPPKVATPTATAPPSIYYQQAKHAIHIKPSGISIY